ncbi:autotransporter assembly complex protein TamA [Zymomonas mobilis]|uniref:autotransporter assembly complex protein TamA n=1 Tax=Zymomonas mobilis TaxID=542 RepID=UPI0003C73C86|nr:BamA/TamA family outer membrane protein [Zymomonas mobilis]AHB09493.1 autotransporter secretion outer membrane protein TamA [Zymomonas mobilis subsp. mobilis str. CP4 = NRRL B-14023]AHJ69799.1 hypothetical protein A254_00159 [Zymomonas mobilis subsp. mobilis NRRL B-12526]AHJ71654.1 hypothetical protein A265_00159 [Zymomonas mobilis subsp. mobilis str. CP4 = NRRL B-14023]
MLFRHYFRQIHRICLLSVGLISLSAHAEDVSTPKTDSGNKAASPNPAIDPFDPSFFDHLPTLSQPSIEASKADGSSHLPLRTSESSSQGENSNGRGVKALDTETVSDPKNLLANSDASEEKTTQNIEETTSVTLDPALSEPLPDLSHFMPDMNEHVVLAKESDDLRYKVDVKGLSNIDTDQAFKNYSVLLSNKNKADSLSVIGARATNDQELINRILRSQGYYDGKAALSITPIEKGQYNVRYDVNAGSIYKLGQINLTGSEEEPLRIARVALNLHRGDPIIATHIEQAENNILITLPHYGYPFAKIGDRTILLDDETHTGDYTLPVNAGNIGSYGSIIVSNNKHIVLDAKHISHIARFKEGQRYDSQMVDDLRQALAATSLFSHVSVEPIATGRKREDGSEIVDLDVRQGRGKKHSIAVTGGYGTGEGFKAQGSWISRNYFPPEGSLTFSGILGTRQQQLSALFNRNNAGARDRVIQIGLTAGRERYDAYNGYSFSLGGSLSRQSTQLWQKRWTYSIGAELTQTNERSYDFSRSERLTRSYLIAALPGQLGYDRSNNLMNPTKGYRLNMRLSPETSIGSGLRGYVRMLFDASGYYPVADNVVLAGRFRVASIEGASVQELAPSRRIYAGGGGSVRGYGYQQLGPKDPYKDAVGGLSEEELAFEVRYRFGNFGLVPFIDAGQVYEDAIPTFHNLRFGTGLGARYYTAFGPFRIDLATPIARQPGESRISVYISIGQAF